MAASISARWGWSQTVHFLGMFRPFTATGLDSAQGSALEWGSNLDPFQGVSGGGGNALDLDALAFQNLAGFFGGAQDPKAV